MILRKMKREGKASHKICNYFHELIHIKLYMSGFSCSLHTVMVYYTSQSSNKGNTSSIKMTSLLEYAH